MSYSYSVANVFFDLMYALVGSTWLGWNTCMCIRDIKFASCTTFSSNCSWFELVWAGMCIFWQGMLLMPNCFSRTRILCSHLSVLDFQGRRRKTKN